FEQTEFEVTSRIKNMGTLREKLMRTNLRLSGIRDVVGCRVVATNTSGPTPRIAGIVGGNCHVGGAKSSWYGQY
ncbi:MAG: hypothetical protein AAB018_01130, partial [Actinomycetota bacterium]